MEKTVVARKLEIMQDIADIVSMNRETGLGQDIAALAESQEYAQCGDYATKMNMELALIESKVPDEAKRIYRVRVKLSMLKGVEVFGEPSKFLQWANKQTGAFGGESWRSIVMSSSGLQKMIDELDRVSDNARRNN
jgi:hypothetical protein